MANRIRELRKQKGITMKQLGTSLGLAESTISQYETGHREPDIKTLTKLADYFGVTIDYLLGSSFDIQHDKADPSTDPAIDMEGIDIAFYGAYKELSEEDKETIRKMVEIMRERRKDKK